MRIGDPGTIILAAYYTLLLWAVFTDVLTYRIPNRISLGITVLYFIYALFVRGEAVNLPAAVAVAAGVFAVATVLFALRLMGGGDVKLLAAVALWAGPGHVLPFLVVTSIAGGVLALVALTPIRATIASARARLGFGEPAVPACVLPYGVAIAVGGIHVGAVLMAAQGGAS